MIMLTLAGATFKPIRHIFGVLLVLKLTLTAMLWLGLGVDILFVVINRFSQVRERTHQFAILRVLGASSSFILILLLQETILVVAAGTIGGIVLAYAVKCLMAYFVPDLVVIQALYHLWPFVGITPAAGFFFAGFLAASSATEEDLVEALSYKE